MNTACKDLHFDPCCTIVEAQSVRDRLLAEMAADTAAPIRLDLSDVSEADVTLVQLLLAAKASAAAKGRAFTVSLSPAVADLLARAGIAGWPEAVA